MRDERKQKHQILFPDGQIKKEARRGIKRVRGDRTRGTDTSSISSRRRDEEEREIKEEKKEECSKK